MKIIFVFDGLQFGGIERVGVEYIKLLNKKNYKISVINLRPNLSVMEKEIPTNIKVIHIPFPRYLAPQRYSKLIRVSLVGSLLFYIITIPINMLQKFYKIKYKKELPETEVAIAFSGHYNDLTFVAENFNTSKKIAWLHGNETSYNEIAPGYFVLYKKIKNLICLSEKNDDLCKTFNEKQGINKSLIYNPINLEERKIDNNVVEKLKKKYGDFILMVGRLAKDKDQATLIRAIYHLKKKYNIEKNLVLVGDGPVRVELENLVQEYMLEKQVFFAGAHYDVQNYYTAAYVYAHSSPAEGLPTVLLEAMFYELPIASTNSEPGVYEILRNNCGLITSVGDSEALADSIYRLYTDKRLVAELKMNCQNRIKQFMPKNVIMQFENYIKTLK